MTPQQLFNDFNKRYFRNKLPRHQVVPRSIAGARYERHRQQIILGAVQEHEIPAIIIHEMIHAATTDRHDRAFNKKLLQLKEAGAPVLARDFIDGESFEKHDRLLAELVEGWWESPNWAAQLRWRAYPLGIVNSRNRLTSKRWAVVLRKAKKQYSLHKAEERKYNIGITIENRSNCPSHRLEMVPATQWVTENGKPFPRRVYVSSADGCLRVWDEIRGYYKEPEKDRHRTPLRQKNPTMPVFPLFKSLRDLAVARLQSVYSDATSRWTGRFNRLESS